MAARRKRPSRTTELGEQKSFLEPEPSTRLDQVKRALGQLDFSYTIFFTDERGRRIKHFCGSVVQQED